jgi:methionine-rich copper-binding protein CopC
MPAPIVPARNEGERAMMWWRRLALPVLAAMLAVAGAGSVLAHARFDHSSPSPGQVLQSAPAQIDIFTAQDMRKLSGANEITVTGPDGNRVDNGNTVVDDANRRHFSVGLNPNLPNGRYVVSFKTLSDQDGEMDHGSYAFYIGAQPTLAQKNQDQRLALTAQAEDVTPSSSSHTGVIIIIVIVALIVLALAATALSIARRRRSRLTQED